MSWNGHLSASFKTSNGVRQGGILSPYIFSVYMDSLTARLNKIKTGLYLNDSIINHLLYADDVVIFSPCLAGFRDLLSVCSDVAEELKIKFNVDKTVCMQFVPKRYENMSRPIVSLGCSNLNFVDNIKYLGHIISSYLSDDADIAKVRRGIYLRGNILLRKFSQFSDDVKIVLFRTYLTPMYCCHLWCKYSTSALTSVRTAYNSIFRSSFRLGRLSSMTQNT